MGPYHLKKKNPFYTCTFIVITETLDLSLGFQNHNAELHSLYCHCMSNRFICGILPFFVIVLMLFLYIYSGVDILYRAWYGQAWDFLFTLFLLYVWQMDD